MQIDWLAKLRHFLQVTAFCLAIAAIQVAFKPAQSYELPLVYSLSIGLGTWALIDFGRHLLASSRETGWPRGWQGLALPLAGMVLGYLLGTMAGDAWFGWSSWDAGGRAQLALSITITALAGLVASYYFYSAAQRGHLRAQASQASSQAAEARLKLLETQLEPHMLFNTLANLRALIDADAPRAQVMLDHLIAYLRSTLNASRASSHSLQAEFERLRDYLELMAVRMGPRLQYQLLLPPELATQAVPTLLLQPLVENALQHGLEPRIEGGSVRVRARRESDRLVLEVQDSGVGLAEQAPPRAGFGLTQVRERLHTAFGARASVELVPNGANGTLVRISFPCQA